MQAWGNQIGQTGSSSILNDIAPLIPHRLTPMLLEMLYSIPLIQKICNQLPSSAAGGGWKIGFDGNVSNADKVNKDLLEYEHRICSVGSRNTGEETPDAVGTPQSIASLFKQAQIEANIYRGAIILIIAEDGKPSDQPLDVKTLARVRRLTIINSNRVIPVVHNTEDAGNPEFYQLIMDNSTFLMINSGLQTAKEHAQGLVHHSRVIRFDGIKLPPDGLIRNDGWGLSRIESILPSYLRYLKAMNASTKSVENHQLLVMKIKDLHDSIRRNRQPELEQRMTFNKMVMDLLGAIALDSDNEDLSYVNTTFAGMEPILAGARDLLIGESDTPHDRLFGESPSGLGATGENERNNWSDTVSDFQSNDWHPKLRKLYQVMWYCKDGATLGKVPDGWKIQFKKLVDRTVDETVQTQTAQGELDVKYLEAGVILKKEARSRLSSPDYEAGITLDDKAWEEEQKKAAEAAAAAPPAPGAPGAAPEEEEAPPNGKVPPGANGKVPPPSAGGKTPPPPPGANGKVPAAVTNGKVPPKAQRKDAIAMGGFSGDLTYVDSALYEQATQEAAAKFRVLNAAYAQAYIRSRYQHLLQEARPMLDGDMVEIGGDGEILGPCTVDSLRCLPRGRAGRMSPVERLLAITQGVVN